MSKDVGSRKSAVVGLIGLTNAGKSTFLNALLGEKVAMVSEKPQSTRRRVRGLLTDKNSQLVIVDAPGRVVSPKDDLNRFLEEEFIDVVKDSDSLIVFFNLDAKKKQDLAHLHDLVVHSTKPWMALITKVDQVENRTRIEAVKEMLKLRPPPLGVYEYSDNWGKDRVQVFNQLLAKLRENLPTNGFLYEEDLLSAESMRDLIAEFIREKCFLNLKNEVPYQVAVQIRSYDEVSKPRIEVHADIIVGRESHLGLVVGSKASMIKKISQSAREDAEKLIGKSIVLKVKVVLKESWFKDPNKMKELGYAKRK